MNSLHPRRPVAHILFDLDGTLVDSARITCAIIDAMLIDRGIDFSADINTVRAMDAIGGEAMIAAVMGEHCHEPAREIAEFRARHAQFVTPPDLAFPGVAQTLSNLSEKGVAMAICSNKPQPLCERILTDLALARHFRAIIGARPDLPRKPDPTGALSALAAMDANPANSLFVGDSPVDVATARSARLDVALVAWGYALTAARMAAPEATIIDRPGQLLDYA